MTAQKSQGEDEVVSSDTEVLLDVLDVEEILKDKPVEVTARPSML